MSNNAKMAYLTAFEYGKEDTMEKIKALDAQGVTYIELLVPFSDPVAENPEIQDASLRALQNGCTIEKIFDMLQELQGSLQAKIILSLYINTAFRYGYERFCKKAAECGVFGLIGEDLPFEERMELKTVANSYGLQVINILARCSEERTERIAQDAQGILCVSPSLNDAISEEDFDAIIARVKKLCSVPVLVKSNSAENSRFLVEA